MEQKSQSPVRIPALPPRNEPFYTDLLSHSPYPKQPPQLARVAALVSMFKSSLNLSVRSKMLPWEFPN